MSFVTFDVKDNVALITLDRPQALNALNMDMVDAMKVALHGWADDEDVGCIVITSSSPRAFCAGGDVREAVSQIKDDRDISAEPYFRAEYGLDLVICSYPKPIISLVDGIVMGGGLGLARLSSHMLISPTIKLAMPETAIGLFPDVGASLFLRRLPDDVALMMGMTGHMLEAGDALGWGLADHIAKAEDFEDIISALRELSAYSDDEITACLSSFKVAPPEAKLAPLLPVISDIFSKNTLADIQKAAKEAALGVDETIRADVQVWADALAHRAPSSIALYWFMMRVLPAPDDFIDAIQRDFQLACKMMRRTDFEEGVRAVLIDKDNQPQWAPASLDEINQEFLEDLCEYKAHALLPVPSFLPKNRQ